jgi:hypothetical protein
LRFSSDPKSFSTCLTNVGAASGLAEEEEEGARFFQNSWKVSAVFH